MSKHKTLIYLKYSKLINKINDNIIHIGVKHDMIKFLANFPGTLKHPYLINQFNPSPAYISRGRMIFNFIRMPLYYIEINFDGKNNFQLWMQQTTQQTYEWTSIDDLNYYVNTHPDTFCDILTSSPP